MDNNDDKASLCKRVYGIHPKYLFIETNSFAIFKTNNYMINLEINIHVSRSWRHLLLITWSGHRR